MLLEGRKFGRSGSSFSSYYEIDTDVVFQMRRRTLKARHIYTVKGNCTGKCQWAEPFSLNYVFKNYFFSMW